MDSLRMGTPWKGCPQKVDLAEEVWQEEEFWVRVGLLQSPRAVGSSSSVTSTLAGVVLLCDSVAANMPSI